MKQAKEWDVNFGALPLQVTQRVLRDDDLLRALQHVLHNFLRVRSVFTRDLLFLFVCCGLWFCLRCGRSGPSLAADPVDPATQRKLFGVKSRMRGDETYVLLNGREVDADLLEPLQMYSNFCFVLPPCRSDLINIVMCGVL